MQLEVRRLKKNPKTNPKHPPTPPQTYQLLIYMCLSKNDQCLPLVLSQKNIPNPELCSTFTSVSGDCGGKKGCFHSTTVRKMHPWGRGSFKSPLDRGGDGAEVPMGCTLAIRHSLEWRQCFPCSWLCISKELLGLFFFFFFFFKAQESRHAVSLAVLALRGWRQDTSYFVKPCKTES